MTDRRSDIAALRREYSSAILDESHVAHDPLIQFHQWFEQALQSDVHEANAMTLATADAEGRPSARIVLLKGLDERGFVFFTNYLSRKGKELDENPKAAILFFWDVLERQVRIEGRIERISEKESEEYFESRPAGSRIGAIASPQSNVIKSREELELKVKEIELSGVLKKPAHWGGFRLIAHHFEFWQGRPSRLHDRIVYDLDENKWRIYRLAP